MLEHNMLGPAEHGSVRLDFLRGRTQTMLVPVGEESQEDNSNVGSLALRWKTTFESPSNADWGNSWIFARAFFISDHLSYGVDGPQLAGEVFVGLNATGTAVMNIAASSTYPDPTRDAGFEGDRILLLIAAQVSADVTSLYISMAWNTQQRDDANPNPDVSGIFALRPNEVLLESLAAGQDAQLSYLNSGARWALAPLPIGMRNVQVSRELGIAGTVLSEKLQASLTNTTSAGKRGWSETHGHLRGSIAVGNATVRIEAGSEARKWRFESCPTYFLGAPPECDGLPSFHVASPESDPMDINWWWSYPPDESEVMFYAMQTDLKPFWRQEPKPWSSPAH